ncbi:MAG: endonuclease/exonuclease/phosphatase family protein [Solirubrobacteraceae bacterium]
MSRSVSLAAVAALSVTMALPASSSAASNDVTVMSRNLYLGADIIPLASAADLPAFEQTAAQVWRNVQATDFPKRATALAKEVKTTKPDLIGLQEAAVWRKSPDGVKDGQATAANVVVYDYIKTLRAELKKAGVEYRVVIQQDEFDFEAPTVLGYDIRLTQRDAILERVGTKVSTGKTYKGRYSKTFIVPTQAGTANSKRGWVAVDAKVGGKSFRFVDTHLEAYGGDIREAQAKQLLGSGGPLTSKKKNTILVGDLNSDPRDAAADAAAYKAIAGAGFVNVFGKLPATSGQNELVNNPTSTLKSSIDHILVRPKQTVVKASVVGNKASERVGGLWPSDHAGVVATLRLK